MSIYRTLLILEKEKGGWKFLYGHSIKWLMTPLDYSISSWIDFNIHKNVYVFAIDFSKKKPVDDMIDSGVFSFRYKEERQEVKFEFDCREDFFRQELG